MHPLVGERQPAADGKHHRDATEEGSDTDMNCSTHAEVRAMLELCRTGPQLEWLTVTKKDVLATSDRVSTYEDVNL